MLAAGALAAQLAAAPIAAAQPPPVDVVAPGYPMRSDDPNRSVVSNCTVGFIVLNARGTPIMLTAGHCDEGGAQSVFYRGTGAWEPVGTFLINEFDPTFADGPDIGVVPIKNTVVPASADLLGRTPVTGAARPTVGQRLCKVGSYSGTTCGEVTKVTSSKVYFEGFTRHGDSGGPVYLQNGDGTVTAVGITSATPDDQADCRIDTTGARDCGGTAIAELVVPWLRKWDLSF